MPDTGEEARKTLQDELDEVRADLIRLGALTGEAITAGTQAFLDGDLSMAERVIAADDVIDDLYHSIEDHIILILATQSPVAADLRAVITMLRINHELERDPVQVLVPSSIAVLICACLVTSSFAWKTATSGRNSPLPKFSRIVWLVS